MIVCVFHFGQKTGNLYQMPHVLEKIKINRVKGYIFGKFRLGNIQSSHFEGKTVSPFPFLFNF